MTAAAGPPIWLVEGNDGERCVIGNAPVPLEDPDAVEVVKSGAVALFAVEGGGANGQARSRRYLFTVEAGSGLFGLAPGDGAAGHTLLAVSLGTSCFLRVPWASLAPTAASAAHGRGLVEAWAARLASALASLPAPAAHLKVSPGTDQRVKEGRTIQMDGGAPGWVRVKSGVARWLGLQGFACDARSGPILLCDAMWLEADGSIEIEVCRTEDLGDAGVVRSGLARHQASVLRAIAILEASERDARAQRLAESDARSERVTADALANLASILAPRGAPLPEGGSPIFIAACAVGQAIGAAIRPAAASEDLSRAKSPLDAIARASRVRTRSVILRPGFWTEDCGPLIARIAEGQRPVALLPLGPGRYELFDPVDRSRRPLDRTLAETLEPTAVMLYRPLPDRALAVLDLLRFSLAGHGREIALIGLLTVAATLAGMFVPIATAVLIDRAIPGGDRGLLFQVALGLFAAATGAAAFQVSQGILATRAQAHTDHALQAGMWDRLLQLRMSFFRRFSAGDLKTRVTAVYQIRQILGGTTLRALLGGVASILNLGLLFYYSGKLALVAAAIGLVSLVATSVAGAAILRKDRALVALRGTLLGLVVQLVNGVSKLRLAGAERRAFAHWAHRFAEQQRLGLAVRGIQDAVIVLNGFTAFAGMALVFAVTSDLVFRPAGGPGAAAPLTTGAFLAFNAAFGAFLAGAASLSETITGLLEVVNLAERARPILEEPTEVNLAKTDPGRLRGKIALERVIFRYPGAHAPTLDGVTVRAEPGEFIALVGESGSGKSTIMRLLLGFESVESGGVYFDDQDSSRLDMHAVRRQLGVVMQAGRISAGSIHDNIGGGALVTLDEVNEAARNAGLEEDIAAMPMGLHTVISEGGTNLSGGQRQRLLIARAIVLKPKILLFDEATSALDNRTQARVSESLDRLQATRIVIAHRMSTIRKANRIYVLERGKVIQTGTYDELAKQEGSVFARLVARQKA